MAGIFPYVSHTEIHTHSQRESGCMFSVGGCCRGACAFNLNCKEAMVNAAD